MSAENETIADIVAEMRKRMKSRYYPKVARNIMQQYANRFEAACEREVGNTAAMRKALIIAKKAICNHARKNHTCDSLAWENSTINANCGDILCAHRDLCEAKTAIQKALLEKPRNCDVGTAEEQGKRFQEFCDDSQTDEDFCSMCARCSLKKEGHCEIVWAQMPYEAEEGGAK